MKTCRVVEVQIRPLLNSVLKESHWVEGWVVPRASMDAMGKRKFLASAGNRTPIPPSSSP
jgi:hypothetical protein